MYFFHSDIIIAICFINWMSVVCVFLLGCYLITVSLFNAHQVHYPSVGHASHWTVGEQEHLYLLH